MDFLSLCRGLQDTAFAIAVRESTLLFPLIEGLHVLAITFLVGSVAVVDLRLLGIRAFAGSIRQLMVDVLPFTWTAFAIAILTGAALFSSDAEQYSHNVSFQLKIVLLGLVGLNALVFHGLTCRTLDRWDEATYTPWSARAAGIASLIFWIGIVACGRGIGFANT
jgi:predicted membrane protein